MKYFYLKLGFGNEEVEVRLNAQPPKAVIYFGMTTVKEFLAGRGDKQGQDFCEAGLAPNRKKRKLVVTCRGTVWILQPAGNVHEEPTKKHDDGTPYIPKVMAVRKLKKLDYMEVPAVLAEIHCNAWVGRGTFRPITNWGNIKAIELVSGRSIPKAHLRDDGPDQLLECLSSVELETLVAKLLEEAGCFVEARRGGTRLHVDIVAHNDGNKNIDIGGHLTVPARRRVAIQVKGWTKLTEPAEGVDYLIGLLERETSSARVLDGPWLLKQVQKHRGLSAWLRRSLRWLPSSYLDKWRL